MTTKYITKKGKTYWPSPAMKKIAWVNSKRIYKEAEKNPISFWGKQAKENLLWDKPWSKKNTYVEKLPYFWWFKGGMLNLSENCLDRHLDKHGNKTALIWVPEPTKEPVIKLTYKQLYEKVNKFANVLKKLGAKKGDVIGIYLPLIPEAIISMLACMRIGAVHSVVFSAFSAEALKKRLQDGKAKMLITADGYYRRGKKEDLLSKAKASLKGTKVRKVILVNRLRKNMKGSKKFLSFSKLIKDKKIKPYCKPKIVKSEDPSFILYTSGTTGHPKGIIHDTGGYSIQALLTAKFNFNLHPGDVMWCTADLGWITGHTYACYGPLLNGATSLIYEGSPDFPNLGRWWKIIQDNKVNVFYTAPTAIRMFMKLGDKHLKNKNLNSLKILGTVGEPIDIDAWNWYLKKIGKSRCPVIDTWWQTETGGTLINSLPGIGPFIPTIAGKSFPGTKHEIVNDSGRKVKTGKKGYLVQVSPFAPGMLHGVWKNHKKYVKTYWKKFKTKYDTSDGAYLTKQNYFRLTGRVDDVMKVAGHRLATAELENAINDHALVNESAVVPIPDKIKGQVPVAFVILKKQTKNIKNLEKQIISYVIKQIGPTAKPKKVYFVSDLPKTRSGKIMRRVLKAILSKEKPKGLTTLLNPKSVEEIKEVVNKK